MRLRLPLISAVSGLSAALIAPVAGVAKGVRRSIGSRAVGEFDSPQFRDGTFHNREPMRMVESGGQGSIALEFATKGDRGRPGQPVPLVTPRFSEQAADCAATWLGHATVLLEIAGHWVLTDPVWSDRVSPSASVGPKRNHPMPIPLDQLPQLDAVLISHDHYDHLDTATIDRLTREQEMPFVVPLGVGAHLRSWGVPAARIIELDWDQAHTLGDLTLTCTEARHFSGRLFARNTTLWSSWVIAAGERRVFFGGDSGYTTAFAQVGANHGPFDLTILPIGAYDKRWPDVHMDPAEAVQTHLDLRGQVLLPIHWATFDLAFHDWAAPAQWLARESVDRRVDAAQPRPGERFEIEHGEITGESSADLSTTDWWSATVRP